MFVQIIEIVFIDGDDCRGPDTDKFLVHYVDFPDAKWDEWLKVTSPQFRSRVAPNGSLSSRGVLCGS